MSENKRGKYFKYAIGEIILVVIGILLALQINNWNESRKQRDYETQLIIQLKKDLEFNIKDIELNIKLQTLCITSCEILIDLINHNSTYQDSLLIHFSQSGLWTKAVLNAGSYSTIKSKGLDVISNPRLRELVFNIYEGDLVWLKHMEDIVIEQIEDFRTRKGALYFKKWESTELKNGELVSGEVLFKDYELLMQDNNYQYFLQGIKTNSQILRGLAKNYLADNKEAISLIDKYLITDD
ncbi:hypothetical protein J4050_05055 [Winogradskyella sp. DF17]|uniref:Uncharacterized protein n=1 Tax=Winogradskyella pelagia TaxID=2819984 RepID=A0ABS3T036_9FLAO|nr:DUF6090 family protein [Winogradskyella sp. DF17]MBO3116103.1 hypothetical protein [Winogradskyella sp. DF17]